MDTPVSLSSTSSVPDPGELIGHYRVVREIGRGGMATVLQVEDDRTGEQRAIKLMLPSGRGEDIARRFRGEFRALSRLSHPNVLRVYEGGIYRDRPYFVMELLQGRELRDEVNGWRELPPAERFRLAEHVLVQIARALEYIHARGFVHRDVTPANIFLLPDQTARLMDFGVAKETGGELTTVGEVVGTVAYMAPEQINSGRVDARADLYSLGAVLYLMLTGRRPFNARTLAGYLEKHLSRPVRPPAELVPTLPRRLDEVCVRLLAKDPADRFASATHLLHVLGADSGTGPEPDPSLPDWRPPLVGRNAELAAVRDAVGGLTRGKGGVLWIEGASGMGKTRLAEEAVEHARRLGVDVHVARGATTGQQTFAGFRGLYEALRDARGQPASRVLEAAFGEQAPGALPLERLAVGAAMKDLLVQDRPFLLFFDDADRADRGTAELLSYLLRTLAGNPSTPALFVLTCTAETNDESGLRAMVNQAERSFSLRRIVLGPLSQTAVEALLLSVAVDDPRVRALATRLHREGEGNPYFITEMIHGLVERRLLVPGVNGGRGAVVLDESQSQRAGLPVPRTLRDAIQARLQALPEHAGRVAAMLAVARGEVDLDLVIAATNLDEDQAVAALDQLIVAGFVRERRAGARERYELSHNRIVDVIAEDTPEAERVTYHRRIGEALERQHRRQASAVVEVLAQHFELGGLPAKAYPYLVLAAEKLMGRGFVQEALQYLDRALVSEHAARQHMTLEEADRRLAHVFLRRASALFHLGRWAEARNEAARADDLARQVADHALISGTAAELGYQARRRHDLEEADNQLRRALEEAHLSGNRALQTQPLYEMGGVCWSRGDLEGARGYWLEVLATSRAVEDDRSLATAYNGLGLLALCRGQMAEARDYLDKAIALCERLGMVERQIICTSNLSEIAHLTGHFRKGMMLAERTVTQAREMNHRFGLGLGLYSSAVLLADVGRRAEAEERARQALQIQRELGNREDEVRTLLLLGRVTLERSPVEAIGWLDASAALVSRYDAEGYAPVVRAWLAAAQAAAGRPEEAQQTAGEIGTNPGRAWPYQRVRQLLALVRLRGTLGRRNEAADAAREALELSERYGYRYYILLARVALVRHGPPKEAAAAERPSRALAVSLAAGLDREDAQRFLAEMGIEEVPVGSDA